MSLLSFTTSYGIASVKEASQATTKAPKRLLARLLTRLMEYRHRQALAELHRHGLRLPRELEDAGYLINERNEDSLPFVR